MTTDSSPEQPIAQTTSGAVRGTRRADGSVAFLGIPFAEPPTGARRFQAPEPKAPWDGVLDATAYGATPQRKALAEITTIPEPSIPGDSTLNVNVFTPDPTPAADSAGLPVLVWIHGGGFIAGSPASPWYDGRAFNRDGVVTVSVSYRLGIDGFGWLPDAPANRGVLDWILALEWVRDNIAAFGGDPRRVTIAGQSAGGGSVMTLLTVPSAQHLFHRAISVSGVPGDVPLHEAQALTGRLAEHLGVPATLAGFASVPEDTLIEAQGFEVVSGGATDPESVLRGMTTMNGRLGLGPVVDGELVVDTVEAGMIAGRGADKPLLVSATREEFAGFFTGRLDDFDAVAPTRALELMGVPEPLAEAYVATQPGERTGLVAGRFVSDVMFRERVIRWLALRDDAETWVSDFVWRSAVSGIAEHCLDVPFIFDVLDDPDVTRVAGPHAPQELADRIHGAVVAFVRDGSPGWSRSDRDASAIEVFDAAGAPTVEPFASARVLAAAKRLAEAASTTASTPV
ncbi:carboxylesterase/lipase family protein [Plantibacter cousiniae (nom. nud.)]|uniref:carboxylesterase/lipase family protein n=1 Tax=Plantibacter cousiniae (nom. nud.) TaxID=199709 RepID=UPI001DE8A314|nr:carboxylesterase family protein [Plantibacter cousiniae]CAH0197749.1 Carboxylesterase [Plantibacter cousiniae]